MKRVNLSPVWIIAIALVVIVLAGWVFRRHAARIELLMVDVACGMGFCAEHAAIAEMLKHRETRIEMAVAVAGDGVHPPCGRCREFMMQINRDNRDTNVVLPGNRVALLKDLLPEQWIE